MIIEVHLHTILQQQTADGLVNLLEVKLPSGSTISDLLTFLDIEMSADSLLMAVNGRVAKIDQILVDQDTVNLMPAISGGRVKGVKLLRLKR